MTVGNGTWETAIEAEGSHEEETETAKQLNMTKTMLIFVSLRQTFKTNVPNLTQLKSDRLGE